MIRKVTIEDAGRICEIYNYYVVNTVVSFETDAVSIEDMKQRIQDSISGDYPYFVYEINNIVVGYCYLHAWSGRCAYRTSTEISIYIDKDFLHRGIGRIMMDHMLNNIDLSRFHTIIAGIALPNEASIALHEKYGFEKISHFKEIGFKFGKWRDVGHWQLIPENKVKVLILCTGNSCRSQMAHGFLQSFDKNLKVCSAGTDAAGKLNAGAVKAMKEAGIDISGHTSDPVEKYLDEDWDYVITVCGGANESCPAFSGKVKSRIHIGFDDPSHATGSQEFIESEFIRVRDEIKTRFFEFYIKEIKKQEYPRCSCGGGC